MKSRRLPVEAVSAAAGALSGLEFFRARFRARLDRCDQRFRAFDVETAHGVSFG
jgi:hypothetical protein